MHAWAEKQQENNESETRKAYPDSSGKKELRKGVHADNSLIQRQLFIRAAGNPAVVKSDSEMTTAVKAPKGQKALKVKTPQYVNKDPGYTEIKDAVVDEYFKGYLGWLQINNIHNFSDDDLKTTRAKIQSMIHKNITSAQPEQVYSGALETAHASTRLSGGEAFDVAYYFDSLEEFYKYLYVSASFKKTDQSPIPNNDVKINMVNTGSGNAIVITLPRGYLIVDLGTDLNILLNYLALRANKRKAPDTEQANEGNFPDAVPRGIPLVGEESCIVITHNHTDHMGCKAGYTANTIKSIIGDSIVGYTDYAARPSDNDALARLHEFLASGDFQVYDLPQLNPRARYKPGDNSDSLIIARRNEREAIILSGDQEQKFLAPVIEDMTKDAAQNPLPPVSHAFIQAPHHGSSENNTLRVINSLSRLSLATAFAISSGNEYEHPTAGAFANQFNLYPQGTEIQYSSSLSSGKRSAAKKHTVPDKRSADSTRTSRSDNDMFLP